jgi:hypothetical protein
VGLGRVAPEDAVSFSRATEAVTRDLYAAVGHPPSWPANWLFAWRHGVRPDRFDHLFGRVPRRRWVIGPGSEDGAAVRGRGWSRTAGGATPLPWWAVGRQTTLLFTLSEPVDRRLDLRVGGARHPPGRLQGMVVSVNGHRVLGTRLGPEEGATSLVVPARAWERGLNEIRFQSDWTLSASEAWETGQPAHAAWRLIGLTLEPARE